MAAKTSPATEPNLKCPYTGDTFQLVTVGQNRFGAQPWSARGGLDPAAWYSDRAKLEAFLRLRNGRPSNVKELVCPYSGRKITILTKLLGDKTNRYRAVGAWSPRGVYTHKEELEYDISIRKGVLPDFPRRTKIEAGGETRAESNPTDGLTNRNDEYADELVEHVLKAGE